MGAPVPLGPLLCLHLGTFLVLTAYYGQLRIAVQVASAAVFSQLQLVWI